MISILFLLKGILLGFSIAAPVGPIGILCIRRTLNYGRFSGLISGLGAAVADVLFGIVAAFGLTFISDFLLDAKLWLKIGGALFLFYLAVKIFLSKPASDQKRIDHGSLVNDFISTFLLTITNPVTIISYIAIFAALGVGQAESFSIATVLVSGIFLGSALWWLILSEGITFFRKKINQALLTWLNRVAASIIATFGFIALFI